jgi:hypothetical protein
VISLDPSGTGASTNQLPPPTSEEDRSFRLDLLLVCHDAEAASVVGNALVAVDAARLGRSTAILFSGEALLALLNGRFQWSRGFWPQVVRWSVADRAQELGLPTRGKGQWRDLDVAALLEWTHDQNVQFLACPAWGSLLAGHKPWPSSLLVLTAPQTMTLLEETKTVVGSF